MAFRSRPEQPWLSVAMPLHHGERWLTQTFKSLVAQDCGGIEFILLDSSDNDACEQIALKFADQLELRYERVTHVTSWPAKTNIAVERARAPHVAMLHQDDLWLANRAVEVRTAIAAFPHAVLLLNPSYIVDECGRRLGLWRCPLAAGRELSSRDIGPHLLVQNFISIPAPVVQRGAWLDSGGMDEALWYTADWDLYLKLLRHGRAVYRRNPSTAFRVHGSSLTVSGSRNAADFELQMQKVFERHCDLVPSAELPQIRRRASASIAVNCALAQASTGSASALLRAMTEVLSLGPTEALAYIRDSRLFERTLPRLRARLAGSY